MPHRKLKVPSLDRASVVRTVLPNGLTVLVRRDPSAPVVAIVTYVRTGYFDEPDDVVGIAHVLEHMYFKGTPSRGVGEIARQTKAVGGYLNAGTIYDHTSYYAVLPSSGFVQGLDVQFDAYANSVIDAEELEREIEVIVEEAKRKADNPGAVTIETLHELLHDRHRMRRWRIGREPGLRRLTQVQVLRFYRSYYRPCNTVLVVVGDVDPAAALAEVEQRYGTLPDAGLVRDVGPDETAMPPFRFRELAGDVAQTQFALGWRTPGTLDRATPALELLAAVLGSGRASRLYRAVRERSLVQGITAYDYTPTDLGVFVIHAEGPPDLAADAARATWAQVDAIRREPVTPVELERAKRVFESRWLRRFESMEGQANYLAEWESLGRWTMGDEFLARVLATTAEDVRAAAEEWLVPDRASLMVYRPRSAAPFAEDAPAARALLDSLDAPQVTPVDAPRLVPLAPRPVDPPAFEREEAGVRVYRTARGLSVLVRRKPGSAIAHAGVYFQGGATDEHAPQAGLTAMLTRLAVKGTESRTAAQIAEEAELLGGSVGGGAGNDSFGWSVSVPTRHLSAALELLGDVVQRPDIAEKELATERSIAIADIVAMRDDMSRYPVRIATGAAYAGHPYGIPASGTEASLAAIDADALRAWHRRQVLTGDAVAVIVGDVDPDAAAHLAAQALDLLDPAPARRASQAEWGNGGAVAAESRDKKQSALVLLYPGPSRSDDDRFAAQLLSGIASGLGGRFFDVLRDQQSLCYTVQLFHTDRRLAGTFGAYIATSPEKEEAARAGLLAEIDRLADSLVTEEELARAQQYAIGTHAIRQQSGGAVLAGIVDAWMFGALEELAVYDDRIRTVTREQIQSLASTYLKASLRVEGIIQGTRVADRG
ncbi:MAG: insulinase family protein [Gemmatimonadaceae bacterium]|nr:insulinase family protein [Gemmatimonadaceae bacterium]